MLTAPTEDFPGKAQGVKGFGLNGKLKGGWQTRPGGGQLVQAQFITSPNLPRKSTSNSPDN
jgi:hypothetical protein